MPNPNISADLTDADKATISDHLNQARALLPFLANLDPNARRKLRKTGSKREGYVQDVYNGAVGHPDALPPSFALSEWTRDEDLNLQLAEVFEAATAFQEALSDTMLLLGNERIKQADSAYGYMKQGAKSNSALTALVNRVARQFAGQGREGRKTTFNVPAGGQVVVTDVSTSTQLVNIGTTALQVFRGEAATGKAQPVAAGESLSLPGDATSITVSNTNADGAMGVFTVKLKAGRQ